MPELKDPNWVKAMKGLDFEPVERIDNKGKKVKQTVLPKSIVYAPKLNGVRILWQVDDQCFRTNNGNLVRSCDHLVEQVRATRYLKYYPLDGEAYHHDHERYTFSYLNGKVRRQASSAETEFIQFHIFELAMHGITESKVKRLRLLQEMFHMEDRDNTLGTHLIRVPYEIGDPGHRTPYYHKCLADKYEGIMLSDATANYQTGKGKWMWKWKPEHSAEYKFVRLVPALEGRNVNTFASIELMMEDGQTFTCAGISDERKLKILANPPAPGSPITVEFGDWSNTGIPIFPRYVDERYDL